MAVEVHPRRRVDVSERLQEGAHGVVLGRTVIRDGKAEIRDAEPALEPSNHHLLGLGARDVQRAGTEDLDVAVGVFVDPVHERVGRGGELLELALLIAGDPRRRLADVRPVLVGTPGDRATIETRVRFLAQVDDQQAAQLGAIVRDPVDDGGERRRVELVTPGRAERRVESAPRTEVAVLGGTVGIVVENQVGARAVRRCRVAHALLLASGSLAQVSTE